MKGTRTYGTLLCVACLVGTGSVAFAAEPEAHLSGAIVDPVATSSVATTSEAPSASPVAPASDSSPQASAPDGATSETPSSAAASTPVGGVEKDLAGTKDTKWAFVEGLAEFRQLLVVDKDPANDRYMRYVLRGGLVLSNGLRPFVRTELRQYFYPEPGQQFRLRDTSLGVEYAHSVDLGFLGWEGKKLGFLERGSVYLPTSRTSIDQDLIMAPDLIGDVHLEVLPDFTVGMTAHGRYQWHTYADRAGPGAGYNTQLTFDGLVRAEYAPLKSDRFGSLSIGLDTWVSYDKRYPSRPTDELGRPVSAVTYWDQGFGWDLYAAYSPFDALSVQFSIERGGRVNRDGIVNPLFLGHRDETEMVLGVTGRY